MPKAGKELDDLTRGLDAEKIQAIIDAAPSAAELMPNPEFSRNYVSPQLLRLPKAPKSRLAKVERLLEEMDRDLAHSLARYETLKTLGPKALSAYDIKIASQGNAYAALTMALKLVGNHIRYFRSNLELLQREKREIEIALSGGAEQLALI